MDIDDKRIITKTRMFLKTRAWTQRRLAAEMNITEDILSVLLSGRRHWTLRYLKVLAKAMGTRIRI